jgi:predicted negative regulator of RcsB-dependent stress response
MATLDLHEQEQIDAVKAWWNENGRLLMVVVIVALAGFVGVRGWHAWQGKQSQQAATLYASVIQQLGSNDAKRIGDAAQAVVDKFGSTAYAPRAQLLAAQASIQAGDSAKAKSQLQWVVDHAAADGLQNVARLKLASLLLDEKKYGDALSQLNAKHPQSFDGLYDDLKGDVLLAQGKKQEAHAAYQKAYGEIEEKNGYRNLIKMKLDALGGAK